MRPGFDRVGTCPICFGLCATWFVLGLLVYGLGTTIPLFPLAMAGLAGTVMFGVLVLVHGVFYLIRRKPTPGPPGPRLSAGGVQPAPPARRRCCGQ